MGKGRRFKIFRQLIIIIFYKKKYNRCWTWCRGSGGDPTHPHSFIHTTLTHIAEIWLGSNQQPLNREAVLLPVSHRSLVWACAGTYISLFTCMWFYNKLVKALAESLLNHPHRELAGIEPATSEPRGSALTSEPQISCLNMCWNLYFTIHLHVILQ